MNREEEEREEYERYCEVRAYEERRREDDELQKYYVHYFSFDGWIDRMCDEFMKEHGQD